MFVLHQPVEMHVLHVQVVPANDEDLLSTYRLYRQSDWDVDFAEPGAGGAEDGPGPHGVARTHLMPDPEVLLTVLKNPVEDIVRVPRRDFIDIGLHRP